MSLKSTFLAFKKSCPNRPLPNKTKLKFDQDFKAFLHRNILASVGFISNWDKVKFRKTFNWDTGEAE